MAEHESSTDSRVKQLLHNIIALSLPAIASNLVTPLLGMTDVAIAGHLGGAVFLAAIAVGGNMFNLLYWLFGFLRMGSSGLTAQAFGANDKVRQATVLYRRSP
ncbi:MATE family efflux transporter [Paramuribaculum intestinale]|uniref:MATE family efflux transporter n=1 Tax=Paramuribaculum intestinale TaxID=2094151 RepID=UPI00351D2F4C